MTHQPAGRRTPPPTRASCPSGSWVWASLRWRRDLCVKPLWEPTPPKHSQLLVNWDEERKYTFRTLSQQVCQKVPSWQPVVRSVQLGLIYLSASTLSFLKAVCSVSSSQSFPPASMVGGGPSVQPPSWNTDTQHETITDTWISTPLAASLLTNF